MSLNDDNTKPSLLGRLYYSVSNKHQNMLDKLTPRVHIRWVTAGLLFCAFIARVAFVQGYYIIAYALGIYLLNIFILFLSPMVDPAFSDDSDGLALPTRMNEEFRPFMRRLPEFKFWYSFMRAVTIGILCTCFEFFNIPVFWPVLVMYFIILFTVTMKKQIMHMIRYRYFPFTYGKVRYPGKEDTGKVVSH